MLSYQHAYHAGNPADLHKHAILTVALSLLTRKQRPITVMETHSGRGLYDLGTPEARKTREAAEGIGALDELPDTHLGNIISETRTLHGQTAYPGSPKICEALLRKADRHILMERHPGEHHALRKTMQSAEIHLRDGYEGVLALSPPQPRRGLVLIDPSYEIKTEYETVAEFTPRLIAKWPQAVILVWYPVLPAMRHLSLLGGLKLPIWQQEVSFQLKDGKGMTGSGMIAINPPFGFDAAVAEELKPFELLLKIKA